MKQKYKVFLNDRLIEICAPEDAKKNNILIKFGQNSAVSEIKNWFDNFVTDDSPAVFLTHPEPERFFCDFRSLFLEMPAAGGVVIREGRLLFIFRNGKWDLPKGKSEKGETSSETALREVSEECGITGQQIVKPLFPTHHIYLSPYPGFKGKWIFKETFWFEMKYDKAEEAFPQRKEGITRLKWFSPAELDEVLENTYENLKQIIFHYRA